MPRAITIVPMIALKAAREAIVTEDDRGHGGLVIIYSGLISTDRVGLLCIDSFQGYFLSFKL